MSVYGDRRRTPRFDPEVEKRTTGSGPVVTYSLSPEELERYRTEPKPTKQKGDRHVAKFNLTKDEFLAKRISGLDRKAIEKEQEVTLLGLEYWLNKWGIKDPQLEELALLELAPKHAEVTPDAEVEVEVIAWKDAEIDRLNVALENLQSIRHNASEAHAEIQSKLQEELERLRADNADLTTDIVNLENELAAAVVQRDEWKASAQSISQERIQAQQEAKELDSKLQEAHYLLSHGGEAKTGQIAPAIIVDNVNHPPHYTAGSVECIDAIEAATIGLTGGQAYNTGAAIKYLWRWSRKGGIEDLRKAAWYINRMIGSNLTADNSK